MQMVIDIPEEVYDALNKNSWNSCFVDDELAILEQAFCNGTPLPKGHGRLIDADAINIHDVSPAYGMEVYGVTQDDIEYEPTIIEADKGEEDGS